MAPLTVVEHRIESDPLTEFVPSCLGAKLGKVLKGELRAPECSDHFFHDKLVII